MSRQVCPFHADDDVVGSTASDGGLEFTCDRATGHPTPGPHTWLHVPEPERLAGFSGFAAELRLDVELPAAIATRSGEWLEFGVVEKIYAGANPADFALLVERYSHTAVAATRYSASTFLAAALGRLSRTGQVLYKAVPATGRWAYNSRISSWAVAPEPDADRHVAWADLGQTMEYVPGSTEVCPGGLCTSTTRSGCPH